MFLCVDPSIDHHVQLPQPADLADEVARDVGQLIFQDSTWKSQDLRHRSQLFSACLVVQSLGIPHKKNIVPSSNLTWLWKIISVKM